MTVTEMLRRITMAKAYEFLNRDPDQNIPRLVDWLEKLDKNREMAGPLSKIKEYADNPQSNWFRLAHSFWEDLDDNVRETLFTNFIGNDNLPSSPRLKESRKKYGCNIPWLILLDPTDACNLRCDGCTAEKETATELSFDELDAIIEQGKALGTYLFAFSGGEPFLRRHDLIALCNKHAECVFLAFTNGTLVDEDLAGDLLRVKNMVPILSPERLAANTGCSFCDATEEHLRKAMAVLKEAGLLFGVSCCYDSGNYQVLGSERFFDEMIALGAKFAWFFTYLPLGSGGDPARMATAEQRAYMYRQIRKFRKSKPLFTMDFWNDGEFMGGCVAGGRFYCHINAGGDVEPCVFTSFSDSNIHIKTLLEAYRSPLFMAYYQQQPFNANPLRSCPLLDNPEKLIELVESSDACPTDLQEPEDVKELSRKCQAHAAAWTPVADRLWWDSGKRQE